tara:strand:- start:990 stop:1616 length:627 start_codon:yes stop_codon:yes gene_type:complete
MIGLGCSAASRDPIRPCFNGTLPYDGSYIYLEEDFKVTTGTAIPVVIHDYDNITLDDSVFEDWSFETQGGKFYNEYTVVGKVNKYAPGGSPIITQNDTVTITGNITRYDNGEVWDGDDTGNNGYIQFEFNGGGDYCNVYIDIQNSSSITASNVDRVDPHGAFQVSRQITSADGVKWFNMNANNIQWQGGHSAADEPRVRVSNLRMTVS